MWKVNCYRLPIDQKRTSDTVGDCMANSEMLLHKTQFCWFGIVTMEDRSLRLSYACPPSLGLQGPVTGPGKTFSTSLTEK